MVARHISETDGGILEGLCGQVVRQREEDAIVGGGRLGHGNDVKRGLRIEGWMLGTAREYGQSVRLADQEER